MTKIKPETVLNSITIAVGAVIIYLMAVLFAGCTTTPEGKTVPDTARIALITREAATIGTQEALFRRPELKEKFVLVVAQLAVLESQPDITVESLLGIISQLPVTELQSHDAKLAFSSARLVVAAAGWSTVSIVRAEQLRPVVIALREGLVAGGSVP
jgi:hypothetical protein